MFMIMNNIEDIKDKKILLHACCGPCSLGAIQPLLDEGALITLYYYNPCIFEGEFEKRMEALRTVAEHYGLPLIVPPHCHGAFLEYAEAHAPESEGGVRCRLCMGDRLESAARYALENGFDAYTTTLTVSPHKNSKLIFALADDIFDKGVNIPFLRRDFKKRDGFLKSCKLSEELGIYRQRFCGCEYSCAAAGIDVAEYSARIKEEYAHIQEIRNSAW